MSRLQQKLNEVAAQHARQPTQHERDRAKELCAAWREAGLSRAEALDIAVLQALRLTLVNPKYSGGPVDCPGPRQAG